MEVKPFYDHWISYSTKKTYEWLNTYDTREAKNRRIFKLIDKENDEVRQKAKKERNEEVRALVAFVRKRDKRVQTYTKQLEMRRLKNRQKQEEISRRKRKERIQQLNESGEQAEWMKFENVRSELEEVENLLTKEFKEEISDSLSDIESCSIYCAACNKIFKTPKAFANHEHSKKHKENLQKLKEVMIEEEEDFTEHVEEPGDNIPSENEVTSNEEVEILPKQARKKHEDVLKLDADNNISDVPENDDHVSRTQKNKKRRVNVIPSSGEKVKCEYHEERETAHEKLKRDKKRNKKSSASATKDVDIDKNACCVTCKAVFPSKNKLFGHLKESGHSVFIPPRDLEGQKLKKKVK